MINRWFTTIELPITLEQLRTLPRNAAYKYEYIGGKAYLSPRPKQYHGMLELRPGDETVRSDVADGPIRIRRLTEQDWEKLPESFAAAFARVQPFASLTKEDGLKAAASCLRQTREGGDGPLIETACLVAQSDKRGDVVGAVLVTNMPDVDLTSFDDVRWPEGPPADWLENKLGRPHLTWIFVENWCAGHGIGTALLAAVSNALLAIGYEKLASTFLLGNESSMLWHWRNGFALLAYPASHRRMRELYSKRADEPA